MLQDTYGGRVRVPKEKGAPWSKLHRRGRVRVVDSGAILSGVREGGKQVIKVPIITLCLI